MFFELIGTILAGVATAILVWAVNRALGGRLPKWLVPASAGAAMLLAAISLEYGWYARTTAAMPEGLVVAETVEERSPYRPWTYALPLVSRFVAVDRATIRTHPEQDGQRLVELVFFGRWAATAKVPVLFDCVGHRRAPMRGDAQLAEDGSVSGVEWRQLSPSDPVLQTACRSA